MMPRRNRVTLLGEIIAVPERGTIMGNRGILHDAEGLIRRPWAVKRWSIHQPQRTRARAAPALGPRTPDLVAGVSLS
jgi:hypothetical protein